MRLGLFGGTFNPIHNGHLSIGRQVLQRLPLDRLTLIPSGDPPHKSSTALAPARHRLEMVRLAIQDEPGFEVSDLEVRASVKSYSINTVETVRQAVGAQAVLYFIVGLDAFLEFPSWRDASRLLALCHFVVVARPGASFRALGGGTLAGIPELPPMPENELDKLDKGTLERVDVPTSQRSSLVLLNIDPYPISASEIRDRLHQGLAVSSMLPAPVESYIMTYRLYQEEHHYPGL